MTCHSTLWSWYNTFVRHFFGHKQLLVCTSFFYLVWEPFLLPFVIYLDLFFHCQVWIWDLFGIYFCVFLWDALSSLYKRLFYSRGTSLLPKYNTSVFRSRVSHWDQYVLKWGICIDISGQEDVGSNFFSAEGPSQWLGQLIGPALSPSCFYYVSRNYLCFCRAL